MSNPTKSYTSVFYDLRPAKQVERRMIIDTLLRLMGGGIPIRDYQYTGFGSIYFADFILFYKLVGLRRFLSVEFDQAIRRRVAYNKPYATIDIRMEPVGDVIPDLSVTRRHLLWLDYDDRLKRSMLEDVTLAAHHLSVGSLLLITVDVEPPDDADRPWDTAAYLREQAEGYLPLDFDVASCVPSLRASTNLDILSAAISSGLAARELQFVPLFRFVYADGHQMVTLGGMIGGMEEERQVDACDWGEASYLRRSLDAEPYEIHVPRLTRRERLFLDHHMPGNPDWRPRRFELDREELAAYREIHRFYPLYRELMI